MKINDLIKKYPISNLIWNVNEDTDIFWSEVSVLEDNGFNDPWGQRINLRTAKKVYDSVGDVIEFRLWTDFQGIPYELVIMNE